MKNFTMIRSVTTETHVFFMYFWQFLTKGQSFQPNDIIILDVIRLLEIFLTFEVTL